MTAKSVTPSCTLSALVDVCACLVSCLPSVCIWDGFRSMWSDRVRCGPMWSHFSPIGSDVVISRTALPLWVNRRLTKPSFLYLLKQKNQLSYDFSLFLCYLYCRLSCPVSCLIDIFIPNFTFRIDIEYLLINLIYVVNILCPVCKHGIETERSEINLSTCNLQNCVSADVLTR